MTNPRSIIVTGGFGALGRVVANTFVSRGHRVARIDFASLPPERTAGSIDLPNVDLTDGDACARAVETASAAMGGVDALINVAGGFTWETLEDGSVDSWQRMFAMNVLTAATMTKAALPLLKASGTGRIVNIGAGAAVKADLGMGPYAASKAGVHRFTESLAIELAANGITVNAILPSIIDTSSNRLAMPDAAFSSWVKPQAVADVIDFLVSEAARSVSGALIPVTFSTAE